MFTRNLELGKPLKLSSWRKIALGTWKTVGDPSVYGVIDMDVGPALKYLDRLREQTGVKFTLAQFTGKALAVTMARHPQLNCVLRFGRLYPRKTVDVFFQVAADADGRELSGMVIREADKKSMLEIASEMRDRAHRVRALGDPEFKKMKRTMASLPGWASRYALGVAEFVMYTLNLWTPLLGSPRDPFGSVMITNIGSLGLDMAFAPLVPYSRVPLLIALGVVRDMPVVRDGALAVGQVSRMCVTLDHRLIDGMYASHMSRTLHRIFADPERELG